MLFQRKEGAAEMRANIGAHCGQRNKSGIYAEERNRTLMPVKRNFGILQDT